jgi:hypothetical protein
MGLGSTAKILDGDILACNGILHIVRLLLWPPWLYDMGSFWFNKMGAEIVK